MLRTFYPVQAHSTRCFVYSYPCLFLQEEALQSDPTLQKIWRRSTLFTIPCLLSGRATPGDSVCPLLIKAEAGALFFTFLIEAPLFLPKPMAPRPTVSCELLTPGIQFIHISIRRVLSSVPYSWKALTKSLLKCISYIKKKKKSCPLSLNPAALKVSWKGRRRAKNPFSLKC